VSRGYDIEPFVYRNKKVAAMVYVNRRFVTAGLAATPLASCATGEIAVPTRFKTLNNKAPIIIAHRGASGHRPEHTLSAYRLGIEMGADFIEPDLVLTKDGHLVCRHENEIGGTTNVATKSEFAARRTVKIIDGERFEGWFTEDFTLAELKTLRCRERLPQLRPANMAYDGQDEIPTFDEVLALIKGKKTPSGSDLGIYPETKHPTHHDKSGLSFDGPLVRALRAAGLDRANAAVFIQSFEVANLKRLAGLTNAPKIQLVAAEGGPADNPATTYAAMINDTGLAQIATYAVGIGPQKSMIVPQAADGTPLPATDLVTRAHAANLALHPWTFRAENYFLPKDLRRGDVVDSTFLGLAGDLEAECKRFLELGVDGLFSDNPRVAVESRNAWVKGAMI
jgi:glycerophosphoryl diester phosphodiesterase